MSQYKLHPAWKTPTFQSRTPTEKVVERFILNAQVGQMPAESDVRLVAQVLTRAISVGGECFSDAFGIGAPGRPKDDGFRPADRVSAYVELRLRELGKSRRGALAQAKRDAVEAFGIDGESAADQVKRYWRDGRASVEGLGDDDLRAILDPFGDKKL